MKASLQNLGLSDLFFNHRNDNYDALFGNPDCAPSEDEIRAALLLDAKDFCEQLNCAFGVIQEPTELVEDFMGRV